MIALSNINITISDFTNNYGLILTTSLFPAFFAGVLKTFLPIFSLPPIGRFLHWSQETKDHRRD